MKNQILVVSLVLLLCFAFGCQNKAEKAELEKFRAQAALEEQNADLVKSIFEGLSQHNETVYQEFFAPEYGWHFPSNNPNGLTREQEAGFVKMIWAGFPDIRWNIEEIVARGDRTVARFTAKGTHKAEFQGIPPTGNTVEASGIWMARITNGKIVEAREDSDMLGMMQQLGMELKPKEVKKWAQ
jgi:predicted ester cyclase